jgi:hypothetical protein
MIVSTQKQDEALQILLEVVGDTQAVYDGLLSVSKEEFEKVEAGERLKYLLQIIAKRAALRSQGATAGGK